MTEQVDWNDEASSLHLGGARLEFPPNTDIPDCFLGIPQSLQANTWIVTSFRPRLLSSTYFPIHNSLSSSHLEH
jgi:hypothetical protein